MDLEKEYSCLERNALVSKKVISLENDFQETLQQFSNDIYRVVNCESHGNLDSVDISYNEIKINGTIQICLMYYNEDSVLSCADFEEKFSKSITVEGLSQYAFSTGSICDRYTNFRVINPRRIDIHSTQSITLYIYDKESSPCICGCKNSRLLTKTMTVSDVVATSLNRIEYDEEFPISTILGNINRVVGRYSYANVTETKVIKDKVLVKIKTSVVILFSVGDSDDDVESSEFSFESSKIFEIGGIDEGDIVIPVVNMGSIYAKCRNGADDSTANVEVYGDISVFSTVIRQKEISIVSDGYILNRKCDCEYKNCTVAAGGKSMTDNDTKVVDFSFNSDIYEIKNLALEVSDVYVKNEKIIVSIKANAMCISAEGGMITYNSESKCEIDIAGYSNAVSAVYINGFDYTMASSNKLEVRVILSTLSYLYVKKEVKVLSEISASDDVIDYPALTVYFGKENESVWNIAKTFSSDIELIQKENDLGSDVLESNKVIIIPGV